MTTTPLPGPVPARTKSTLWLKRRSIPVPTWRTLLALLLLGGVLIWSLGKYLHSWLSVTEEIPAAEFVVIEGWAPDYVVEDARRWAEDHETRLVLTTGVPLDSGGLLSEYKDYAHAAAATLAKMGYEQAKIYPVPALHVQTERTRAMAKALKAFLDTQNIAAADKKLNLFTLGTHARRSRRIFQHTLGSDWQVGIIAVPSRNYNPETWYRQSAGAKTVIDEVVALTVQGTGGE